MVKTKPPKPPKPTVRVASRPPPKVPVGGRCGQIQRHYPNRPLAAAAALKRDGGPRHRPGSVLFLNEITETVFDFALLGRAQGQGALIYLHGIVQVGTQTFSN